MITTKQFMHMFDFGSILHANAYAWYNSKFTTRLLQYSRYGIVHETVE